MSPQKTPARSLSHDELADKIAATLDPCDPYSRVRDLLRHAADKRDQWAGIPMPIEGEKLIIEPKFPDGKALSELGAEDEELPDGVTLRNSFYCRRKRQSIYIWNEPDGRVDWTKGGQNERFDHEVRTLGCSVAWGVEQEAAALNTLGGLLSHVQLKGYLLTGMFVETSKRSNLTYLFRKLKPTVAIRAEGERLRILCTLCMHPIGYYAESYAGAMCPTDDIIAHLMLMRADEPMYWRQSNQHPHWLPQSGL